MRMAYGQMSAIARTLTKLLSSAPMCSDSTPKNLTRSAVANISSLTFAGQDVTLKNYIQAVTKDAYSSSSSSYLKPSQSNKSSSSKPLSELAVESIRIGTSASRSVDSPDSEETNAVQPLADVLDDIPWLPTVSESTTNSLRRTEVSRGRKKKWVFKSTQEKRLSKLTKCLH